MNEKKTLSSLLENVQYIHVAGPSPEHVKVAGIVTDSRLIQAADLFIALKGEKADGHTFIGDVAAKGCSTIIVEEEKLALADFSSEDICLLAVKNSREVMGDIAATFFDYPQRKLKFIGVTGTNGKTTTTYLLEKILEDRGELVGVIGTVNYRYRDKFGNKQQTAAPFTTPEPLILQKILRLMVDEGVATVLMEVSSHALHQQRIGTIKFDVAAFTNLSHDHLDYHRSMEEYFAAKTLLFVDHLNDNGKAVITCNDTDASRQKSWSSTLIRLVEEKKITYSTCGRKAGSRVQPLHVDIKVDRTELSLTTPAGEFSLVSPLVGRFNVENIITALGVAEALQLDMGSAVKSLQNAAGAPGRLERISLKNDTSPKASVFIDYAHTPDALLNVLKTLKELPHERLFCVFGCGGDRDTTKRPEMGQIAADLADIAIVTEDNPRSESSEKIIREIMQGVGKTAMEVRSADWFDPVNEDGSIGGKGCVVIPDRREAIFRAVTSATKEDVVVIAGKGHEKYQLTNQGKRFFDDGLEAREALCTWDMISVAEALGTELPEGWKNRYFNGITTDSRKVSKGQLFVALRGDNFDGHDYIEKAIKGGAGGIVIAEVAEIIETKTPVFRVADTLRALGDLAAYHRQKLQFLSAPAVIGITGSCGKTTVKEMTSAILEKRWPDTDAAPLGRVLKTSGNFNNLIGLPLSLLPLKLKHEAAVLEMGMNVPGEIARLAQIADPDISCIVNIRGAHLEGLGSIEGVARAKEELFAETSTEGILAVNLDEPLVLAASEKYNHRKIFYTASANNISDADIWAEEGELQENGNVSFRLHIGEDSKRVDLQVPGDHNVTNSLAAAALSYAAGLSLTEIIVGLQSFKAPDKRLQVVTAKGGYSIINDTYNANPASMEAGLATLQSMKGSRKVAVLGDMLELGAASHEAHRVLGKTAVQAGVDYLLLVGDFAELVAEGAVEAGLSRDRVMIFSDKLHIAGWITQLDHEGLLGQDAWLLIKASRGMGLETVVESLVT